MQLTQNLHKTQSKGHNFNMKKVNAAVIVRYTLSGPDVYYLKSHEDIVNVFYIWGVQEFLGKIKNNNQRGTTQKLKKAE